MTESTQKYPSVTPSLQEALKIYRKSSIPSDQTWRQHYISEKFSDAVLSKCSEEEQQAFQRRLEESSVITGKINLRGGEEGSKTNLLGIYNTITSQEYQSTPKTSRLMIFSTDSVRPVGKEDSYMLWNGFQVIDIDIKSEKLTKKIKPHLFNELHKYNWFVGIVTSSSGKGIHVYTKIQISVDCENNLLKKQLLYNVNFRHKFSFVYLSLLNILSKVKCLKRKYDKNDLIVGNNTGIANTNTLPWLDLSLFRPQQGVFIPYDPDVLFSTNYFEDFIYVDFEYIQQSKKIDWVTCSELVDIFKEYDSLNKTVELSDDNIKATAGEIGEIYNRFHYKYFERWRLANTVVNLYGIDEGKRIMKTICVDVDERELDGYCNTSNSHKKSVDMWAVNRLNKMHGFNIDIKKTAKNRALSTDFTEPIETYSAESIKEDSGRLFDSIIKTISNPNIIAPAKTTTELFITKDQHLSDTKNDILANLKQITLIEAGAGTGKTEFVKSLARSGKRVMLVLPFTSIIKSKASNDGVFECFFGNKKTNLQTKKSVCITVDKFSKLGVSDLECGGFDYIFVDESHLLFQSGYRSVMSDAIQLIKTLTIPPIILLSGTPSGETVFFENLHKIHVKKEETRKKEFMLHMTDTSEDSLNYMCRHMAEDIVGGKRILFPTNKGTLYENKIKSIVKFILEREFNYFDDIVVNYYKKSNNGEQFVEDINIKKTISDTNILLCSNYLSVGVDIKDKYDFNIYFNEPWLSQEMEQFANRLRNNDLKIKLFLYKYDSAGNPINLGSCKPLNLSLCEDDIKDYKSILKICNNYASRNEETYRYSPIINSTLGENKFIQFDPSSNSYILDELMYKLLSFEEKYRRYAQQVPVLIKGMIDYGYVYSSVVEPKFVSTNFTSPELIEQTKREVKKTKRKRSKEVDNILNNLTDSNVYIYQEILQNNYDVVKRKKYGVSDEQKIVYVPDVEMFNRCIPYISAFSRRFESDSIKQIFESCKNSDGIYNFSKLWRLKTLSNLVYNDELKRLDAPIKQFLMDCNKLCEEYKYKKIEKQEIINFVSRYANEFIKAESNELVKIDQSPNTIKRLHDMFYELFRCLVTVDRYKNKKTTISKCAFMWNPKRNLVMKDLMGFFEM